MLIKRVKEWKPVMLRQAQHERLPLVPTAVIRMKRSLCIRKTIIWPHFRRKKPSGKLFHISRAPCGFVQKAVLHAKAEGEAAQGNPEYRKIVRIAVTIQRTLSFRAQRESEATYSMPTLKISPVGRMTVQ